MLFALIVMFVFVGPMRYGLFIDFFVLFILEHVCNEEEESDNQETNDYFEFDTQFGGGYVMVLRRVMTHQ